MRKSLLWGSAVLAAIHATQSIGQTIDDAPPPPAAPAATDAATTPDDTAGIEDIVVTAQRRSESLQRAAIAVSAVQGEALLNAGVSEPTQLSKLIPALTVQPTGVSSSFFIRGVGATAINSFQENAIAFSVGGVVFARPTAPAGTFFDVDRIEVLKGPQGTLYGRNATGGAINVIPRQPVLGEVAADLTAEYGNYDSRKVQGGVTLPLGSIAALRVAGQMVDRDGYLSDGYDDEKVQAIRGTLLIQPSSTFSMTLSADYVHQGGNGVGSVLIASPATPVVPRARARIGSADPRITAILEQVTLNQFRATPPFSTLPLATVRNLVSYPALDGFQDSDFWGASMTADGDLGFAKLTAILAYRNSRPDLLTYNPGFGARFTEEDDQMTAEVRLSSTTASPLQYVVGAFYFHEQQQGLNNFVQGLLANTLYAPRLKTTSQAVFGQATYALSDTFRLVAGGRFTKEDKTLAGRIRNTSLFIPNPPFVPISGALNFEKFTWKAGIEWDAGPRSLVFANVATGFKAGGFFPSAGRNTYAPETLTAYTLGSKNRFFDNTLQLNAEFFYWQYSDQQISYVGPIEATPGVFAQAGVTVNAGRARMYGSEVELQWQPGANDTFGATVQYLDAKYRSLIYSAISTGGVQPVTTCGVTNDPRVAAPPIRLFTVDCSGRPALNSPKWTLNLSYEHRFDLDRFELAVGGRSRIESASWLNLDYLAYQRRESYTNSDVYATLSAPGRRWSLTGFVNNIENRAVYAGGITRPIVNTSILTLRPPRTYGARLGAKF